MEEVYIVSSILWYESNLELEQTSIEGVFSSYEKAVDFVRSYDVTEKACPFYSKDKKYEYTYERESEDAFFYKRFTSNKKIGMNFMLLAYKDPYVLDYPKKIMI